MSKITSKIFLKPIPYLRIFLAVFILINLIGIINFPFYKQQLLNKELFFLVFMGFLGYLGGTLLIRLLKFKQTKAKGRLKHKLFRYVFIISNLVSLFLILYINYVNGGIIITMGDARFTNYAYITLFVFIAIVTTLTYVAHILLLNKRIKIKHLLFIGFQAITVLSMGYRSPLIILVVGFCLRSS